MGRQGVYLGRMVKQGRYGGRFRLLTDMAMTGRSTGCPVCRGKELGV